ncbi:hypothetical protein ANOM_004573 [Aspergillus nomiae NRRL 13137]|uniref:Rhodopsin domain-containing protein n=1 Tax=Aspergillus nomiae NRRL (strain ATCC 15546 / NRRL 13137 / CBS 260.88 / M93) TaxID=1509407 RepID=A0A0L1J901_ASPN3|nr:uncharacterized protein ANOM_004573 [Aspergillus nomiae NRRL 13137]KNG88224.1 hypothetical protein ANOM_004573 [Aspergillus nomiae NRRL 13137]
MGSLDIPLEEVPVYIGDRLLIFTALFVPLQIFCVVLRFISRYKVRTPWGLDDAVILFALAQQMGMAGISIGAVKFAGVGHHIPWLLVKDPASLRIWAKYLLALSFLYLGSVNLPKFSILLLYYKLFPTRKMRAMVKFMMVVLVLITIATIVGTSLVCRPFSANWDGSIPGNCGNKKVLYIWASFPNIVTDVILLLLPMPVLWSLNVSQRLKVGLTITFAVGSIGLVTSVIRFQIFFRNNAFLDGTWVAVELIIWTQVETGVYLISACLPTYRPLLEHVGSSRIVSKLSRSMSRRGTGTSETRDTLPLHSVTAVGQPYYRSDEVYAGYNPHQKFEVTVSHEIFQHTEPQRLYSRL